MIEYFMNKFVLFAKPFWINLLILVPIIVYFFWRKSGIHFTKNILIFLALFGIASGITEASAIIYLRAPSGLLPGYDRNLSEVVNLSASIHDQAQLVAKLPKSLYVVEFIRQVATMIMLISIAMISARRWRERFAAFLWTFAVWDISYYIAFRAFIGWPSSLLDYDFLFLVPVPWYSQVWYPLLVSALSIFVILILKKPDNMN